jgi:hypothetical protein
MSSNQWRRNFRLHNYRHQILTAKQQPPSSPFSNGELSDAGTCTLECEIDQMVYKLYNLTPEEIAIVEGKG